MSSIDTTTGRSRGKRWAYGAAVVGGVVSVLANIAHSFVPGQPADLSDETWRTLANATPQPGAVLLAAFWPCALLLAIEVLARVDWPSQVRWTLVRWGGVTPVALVAAVVSYRHLSGLLHWYGEDPLTVAIGPAAVDGLMVVSTGALLALAGLAAPPAHVVPDPIGWVDGSDGSEPIVEPAQSDGSGDPLDERMDGSEPIGSDAEADGSDRVVSIHSVVDRLAARTDGSAAAPVPAKDLARAREAIKSGDLTKPVSADAVAKTLKIGLAKARAVRDTVNAEPHEEPAEA
jgi:hypothetical protein